MDREEGASCGRLDPRCLDCIRSQPLLYARQSHHLRTFRTIIPNLSFGLVGLQVNNKSGKQSSSLMYVFLVLIRFSGSFWIILRIETGCLILLLILNEVGIIRSSRGAVLTFFSI
jgi:hypothetical protein